VMEEAADDCESIAQAVGRTASSAFMALGGPEAPK
jgi:hypothetical protein